MQQIQTPVSSNVGDTLLQQVIDNASAVIYAKRRDGRHLFVNRQFLRVFGLNAHDVIGHTDDELFSPAIAATFRENDNRVFESNAPVAFEETAPQDDGTHTYISVKFPLFDAAGAAYAVCGISTDITERKRTEEALRNAALGVSGATGREIFPALVRYVATTLGVDFALIALPIPDSPGMMRTIAMYAQGQMLDGVEYELAQSPCRDVYGRAFSFHPAKTYEHFPGDNMLTRNRIEGYAGIPLFSSEGSAVGLMAVLTCRPLTDRRLTESMLKIFSVRAAAELERMQAEEAHRQSEASYRAIFEAAEDALFVHDWDTGAIVDVNPKACSNYGYTREELLRLDVAALSSGDHPYTAQEAIRYIERAKAGEPQRIEWHRRNKDGGLHWDEVYIKAAVIAGKRRVLAFTREITERRRAEQELRESEERYRLLFEMESDAIVLVEAETLQHLDVNRAACMLYGYTREEMLALRSTDLSAEQAQTRSAMQSGTGFVRVPLRYHRKKDGTVFPVEITANFFHLHGRKLMLAAIRDITERRRAEEERARLESQLRQAQKMEAIGHLSGGIAHDFNNLLTSVMGYIAMAQERQPGDAKVEIYLERALRSGRQARDLIRQMLTFSRGDRGAPRPLSLVPLAKESLKLLRSMLPTTMELATDLEQEAPAVMLDPVQFEQVLLNLCLNARDAMAGSGALNVGVRLQAHDGALCASCRQPVAGHFVELSVADSGSGIAAAVMDRMFEPFFTTKELGKGSGMGLSVVHGIVHEHGGHILVDNAPGAGATFRVVFPPLARPETAAPRRDEPQRPAARALRGHVLIVDDEPAVAEFMTELCESWGLQVTLGNDGRAAQDAFVAAPDSFDLVLSDQTMPRLTGIELARELHALRPTLPFILYTGYAENLSQEELQAAGVHHLLSKPIDNGALYLLMRDLLRESQRET